MQINDKEEEISRTETFAVFVFVSGKGRLSYWFDMQHHSAERTYV
jgi:hypothetical protein